MRKVMFLVLLMAAIVPLLITSVTAATQYTLVSHQLVEIDRLEIAGNWYFLSRGMDPSRALADKLRQAAVATGRLAIAVSGPQFDEVAASQDRIQDSGRYRNSSKQVVRRGQMIAPSEHFFASFTATMDRKDDALAGAVGRFFSRGQVSVQSAKLTARVEITLSSADISTGIIGTKSSDAITAVGEATSRDVAANGCVQGQAVNYQTRRESIEEKLYLEAFNRAITSLVRQLAPAAGKAMPITVKSGKTIHLGDEVIFYRNDRKIACYEVLAIEGSTLKVRPLWEASRPVLGDQFEIFIPQK